MPISIISLRFVVSSYSLSHILVDSILILSNLVIFLWSPGKCLIHLGPPFFDCLRRRSSDLVLLITVTSAGVLSTIVHFIGILLIKVKIITIFCVGDVLIKVISAVVLPM